MRRGPHKFTKNTRSYHLYIIPHRKCRYHRRSVCTAQQKNYNPPAASSSLLSACPKVEFAIASAAYRGSLLKADYSLSRFRTSGSSSRILEHSSDGWRRVFSLSARVSLPFHFPLSRATRPPPAFVRRRRSLLRGKHDYARGDEVLVILLFRTRGLRGGREKAAVKVVVKTRDFGSVLFLIYIYIRMRI